MPPPGPALLDRGRGNRPSGRAAAPVFRRFAGFPARSFSLRSRRLAAVKGPSRGVLLAGTFAGGLSSGTSCEPPEGPQVAGRGGLGDADELEQSLTSVCSVAPTNGCVVPFTGWRAVRNYWVSLSPRLDRRQGRQRGRVPFKYFFAGRSWCPSHQFQLDPALEQSRELGPGCSLSETRPPAFSFRELPSAPSRSPQFGKRGGSRDSHRKVPGTTREQAWRWGGHSACRSLGSRHV